MVNPVVNRPEQRQLAALFVALDGMVDDNPKLAELVTFWRHQLHAGVEPSHLPELLEILTALTASGLTDTDLRQSVRHWQAILRSRSSNDHHMPAIAADSPA
jgi:hypothetical protein